MPVEPTRFPSDSRDDPRTRPHAVRELSGMFDDVSGRYDFINRLMTLGRDASWRRAMWREVPDGSLAVLDLCCGSGTSLHGLRRPGRLVLGMDASLRMLEHAAQSEGRSGWAPRLACADAFHLPLRDASMDAITIAFGLRNLRPRPAALAEIARVLRPGGTLMILEAVAPQPGPLAPFHAFYVRHVIPWMGRLSPDPSAYQYLSRSILDFGDGSQAEADLEQAGFDPAERRHFMFGATTLWTVRRSPAPDDEASLVHRARLGQLPRGEMRNATPMEGAEWRWWSGVKLVLSTAVLASLIVAMRLFVKSGDRLWLEPWQRSTMRVLLVVAIIGFSVRTVLLALRLLGPPPRS